MPGPQSISPPSRLSVTLRIATCARCARSSNGRTPHFGCGYPGSNPGRAAPSRPRFGAHDFDLEPVNMEPDLGEPPSTGSLVAVVLAAGQGTRMRSRRHKVLHPLAGKP